MDIGRRPFLKGLLALPLLLLQGKRATSQTLHYDLNHFSVAGFQYYAGPARIHLFRPGDSLTLIAEPENRCDAYAVRIEHQGVKLGYVPRTDNRHLSRLLRQGASLTCRVAEIRTEAPTWRMLHVTVGMAG